MNVKIVDTTLRDGEQKAGIALSMRGKLEIFKLLNTLDIYQIEAGIPAMGGDEKRSIEKMVELELKSKVSAWNRMVIKDIQHSLDCGVEILHISVPCSDIQIYSKLSKDRNWIKTNLKKAIEYALDKGAEITIGLEDASRAELAFLLEIASLVSCYGIKRVRYADTVGIMLRHRIYRDIEYLSKEAGVSMEIHTHNDFGMAVTNSIFAVEAGADFVDCTIGGIGERAGNCDYLQFIEAAKGQLGIFESLALQEVAVVQESIFNIISRNSKALPC